MLLITENGMGMPHVKISMLQFTQVTRGTAVKWPRIQDYTFGTNQQDQM
jgi:hypothetical protein